MKNIVRPRPHRKSLLLSFSQQSGKVAGLSIHFLPLWFPFLVSPLRYVWLSEQLELSDSKRGRWKHSFRRGRTNTDNWKRKSFHFQLHENIVPRTNTQALYRLPCPNQAPTPTTWQKRESLGTRLFDKDFPTPNLVPNVFILREELDHLKLA